MSENQNKPQPTQIAQYYMNFLAKRNQITNLEKQLGLVEEEMLAALLKEIEVRGGIIMKMQEELKPTQEKPPVEKLDQVAEEVKPIPPGEKLPGRVATPKEIKKAEVVTPPPTQP